MRFTIAAIAFSLLCSCDRPTAIAPVPAATQAALATVPDAGCWLMRVDGPEPRTAVINIEFSPGATINRVRSRGLAPSLSTSDTSRLGRWRYGAGTDSIYMNLGETKLRYVLWLGRVHATQWSGGVRVFGDSGQAWNTTARLTRAACRD